MPKGNAVTRVATKIAAVEAPIKRTRIVLNRPHWKEKYYELKGQFETYRENNQNIHLNETVGPIENYIKAIKQANEELAIARNRIQKLESYILELVIK